MDGVRARRRTLEELRRFLRLDGRTLDILQEEEEERNLSAFFEHSEFQERVLIAVDVEAYEHGQQHVLEIGMTQFCQPAGTFVCRHLIITENEDLRNGEYVADNQDYFLFGRSERVTESHAAEIVNIALYMADTVVGHALQGDINWLESLGVDTGDRTRFVDTQALAIAANPGSRPARLEVLARSHGLLPQRLHNAGNDAYNTMALMLRQTDVQFQPLIEGALVRQRPAPSSRISIDDALRDGATLCPRCSADDHNIPYCDLCDATQDPCPECGSDDHTIPTTRCMGLYFTEGGTMGSLGDGDYGVILTRTQSSADRDLVLVLY
eukprot:scaffold23069_cov79-Attheya_sp.AAC.1